MSPVFSHKLPKYNGLCFFLSIFLFTHLVFYIMYMSKHEQGLNVSCVWQTVLFTTGWTNFAKLSLCNHDPFTSTQIYVWLFKKVLTSVSTYIHQIFLFKAFYITQLDKYLIFIPLAITEFCWCSFEIICLGSSIHSAAVWCAWAEKWYRKRLLNLWSLGYYFAIALCRTVCSAF